MSSGTLPARVPARIPVRVTGKNVCFDGVVVAVGVGSVLVNAPVEARFDCPVSVAFPCGIAPRGSVRWGLPDHLGIAFGSLSAREAASLAAYVEAALSLDAGDEAPEGR